jgi:hypothetical protein
MMECTSLDITRKEFYSVECDTRLGIKFEGRLWAGMSPPVRLLGGNSEAVRVQS